MKNKISLGVFIVIVLFCTSVFSQNKIEAQEIDFQQIIQLVKKESHYKTYKVFFGKYEDIDVDYNYAKKYMLGNTSVKSVSINETDKTLLIEIVRNKPSYFVLHILNDAKISVPQPNDSVEYLKSID